MSSLGLVNKIITVEPRYNEGPRDYNKVLLYLDSFHIISVLTGGKAYEVFLKKIRKGVGGEMV